MRLIFDIYQYGDNLLGSWSNTRIFFAHKDALTDDTVALKKIIASNDQGSLPIDTIDDTVFVLDLPQAQEYSSSIENIQNKRSSYK